MSKEAAMADSWRGPHWRRTPGSLEMMRDVISDSAAMSTCEKDEPGQQALCLLAVQQQADLMPTAATSACEKGEQGQQALGPLASEVQRGGKAAASFLEQMDELMKRMDEFMQQRGLELPEITPEKGDDAEGYSAAMNACEKGEQCQVEKTMELFDETKATTDNALISACEKGQTSLVPDVISDSAAMSACENCELCQQALGLLAVTQKAELMPNAASYSSAVSACEKSEQWQQVLKDVGIQTDFSVGPGVMLKVAVSPEAAAIIAQQWALELFAETSATTDNALISACEKGQV